MDRDDLRRRSVLAGVASLVGLGGCNGLSPDGSGELPTESGVTTAPSHNQTPERTAMSSEPQATPSNEQILASRDDKVVPVSSDLDASDAIDPSETDTPIGDAVRKIDADGEKPGFGTVLLPPGTVTEAEPLVPTQFTRFLGWGINTTSVEFTDLSRDGIRVEHLKQGKFVTLDGFTLDGSDLKRREGGSAIHFANDTANPKHFNVGSLAFRDWIDPVVHFEAGSLYGSRWEHLNFGFDQNDGREIVVGTDQSLLGTQFGFISAGNRTGDPVISTNFSGARFHVGFLNIGGSAGQAVDLRTTYNGHVSFGGINFESGASTSDPVVSLGGPASARIEYVTNADASVPSVVRLGRENGHNVIGRVRNSGTVGRSKLEVTDPPAAPSFYFGPSDDFTTDVGSLEPGVWALGDMRKADGTTPFGANPQVYDDPSPGDLDDGELAIASSSGGTPSLVYRDDSGGLHFWESR